MARAPGAGRRSTSTGSSATAAAGGDPELGHRPAAGSEPGAILLPRLIGSGFELSSSEARRLIKQGGVKLDGEPVAPDTLELPRKALAGKVLQVGKRRFLSLYDSAA